MDFTAMKKTIEQLTLDPDRITQLASDVSSLNDSEFWKMLNYAKVLKTSDEHITHAVRLIVYTENFSRQQTCMTDDSTTFDPVKFSNSFVNVDLKPLVGKYLVRFITRIDRLDAIDAEVITKLIQVPFDDDNDKCDLFTILNGILYTNTTYFNQVSFSKQIFDDCFLPALLSDNVRVQTGVLEFLYATFVVQKMSYNFQDVDIRRCFFGDIHRKRYASLIACLKKLTSAGDSLWWKYWCVVLKIYGHFRSGKYVNELLEVCEIAFKVSNGSNQILEAFQCWEVLIPNFGLHSATTTRKVRLAVLLTPIDVKNNLDENVIEAKLNTLLCIMHELQPLQDLEITQMIMRSTYNLTFGSKFNATIALNAQENVKKANEKPCFLFKTPKMYACLLGVYEQVFGHFESACSCGLEMPRKLTDPFLSREMLLKIDLSEVILIFGKISHILAEYTMKASEKIHCAWSFVSNLLMDAQKNGDITDGLKMLTRILETFLHDASIQSLSNRDIIVQEIFLVTLQFDHVHFAEFYTEPRHFSQLFDVFHLELIRHLSCDGVFLEKVMLQSNETILKQISETVVSLNVELLNIDSRELIESFFLILEKHLDEVERGKLFTFMASVFDAHPNLIDIDVVLKILQRNKGMNENVFGIYERLASRIVEKNNPKQVEMLLSALKNEPNTVVCRIVDLLIDKINVETIINAIPLERFNENEQLKSKLQSKNAISAMSSISLLNNVTVSPKKPRRIEKKTDDDFVVIESKWKFDPKNLASQQKEKMKDRGKDIPALYQDWSLSNTEEMSSSFPSTQVKESSANALNFKNALKKENLPIHDSQEEDIFGSDHANQPIKKNVSHDSVKIEPTPSPASTSSIASQPTQPNEIIPESEINSNQIKPNDCLNQSDPDVVPSSQTTEKLTKKLPQISPRPTRSSVFGLKKTPEKGGEKKPTNLITNYIRSEKKAGKSLQDRRAESIAKKVIQSGQIDGKSLSPSNRKISPAAVTIGMSEKSNQLKEKTEENVGDKSGNNSAKTNQVDLIDQKNDNFGNEDLNENCDKSVLQKAEDACKTSPKIVKDKNEESKADEPKKILERTDEGNKAADNSPKIQENSRIKKDENQTKGTPKKSKETDSTSKKLPTQLRILQSDFAHVPALPEVELNENTPKLRTRKVDTRTPQFTPKRKREKKGEGEVAEDGDEKSKVESKMESSPMEKCIDMEVTKNTKSKTRGKVKSSEKKSTEETTKDDSMGEFQTKKTPKITTPARNVNDKSRPRSIGKRKREESMDVEVKPVRRTGRPIKLLHGVCRLVRNSQEGKMDQQEIEVENNLNKESDESDVNESDKRENKRRRINRKSIISVVESKKDKIDDEEVVECDLKEQLHREVEVDEVKSNDKNVKEADEIEEANTAEPNTSKNTKKRTSRKSQLVSDIDTKKVDSPLITEHDNLQDENLKMTEKAKTITRNTPETSEPLSEKNSLIDTEKMDEGELRNENIAEEEPLEEIKKIPASDVTITRRKRGKSQPLIEKDELIDGGKSETRRMSEDEDLQDDNKKMADSDGANGGRTSRKSLANEDEKPDEKEKIDVPVLDDGENLEEENKKVATSDRSNTPQTSEITKVVSEDVSLIENEKIVGRIMVEDESSEKEKETTIVEKLDNLEQVDDRAMDNSKKSNQEEETNTVENEIEQMKNPTIIQPEISAEIIDPANDCDMDNIQMNAENEKENLKESKTSEFDLKSTRKNPETILNGFKLDKKTTQIKIGANFYTAKNKVVLTLKASGDIKKVSSFKTAMENSTALSEGDSDGSGQEQSELTQITNEKIENEANRDVENKMTKLFADDEKNTVNNQISESKEKSPNVDQEKDVQQLENEKLIHQSEPCEKNEQTQVEIEEKMEEKTVQTDVVDVKTDETIKSTLIVEDSEMVNVETETRIDVEVKDTEENTEVNEMDIKTNPVDDNVKMDQLNHTINDDDKDSTQLASSMMSSPDTSINTNTSTIEFIHNASSLSPISKHEIDDAHVDSKSSESDSSDSNDLKSFIRSFQCSSDAQPVLKENTPTKDAVEEDVDVVTVDATTTSTPLAGSKLVELQLISLKSPKLCSSGTPMRRSILKVGGGRLSGCRRSPNVNARLSKIMNSCTSSSTNNSPNVPRRAILKSTSLIKQVIDPGSVLKFEKTLPSPDASPRTGSIIKRAEKRPRSDDDDLPTCKRKRVNFSDPPVSCEKFYFKDSKRRTRKLLFPRASDVFSDDSDDDDLAVNPDKTNEPSESVSIININEPSNSTGSVESKENTVLYPNVSLWKRGFSLKQFIRKDNDEELKNGEFVPLPSTSIIKYPGATVVKSHVHNESMPLRNECFDDSDASPELVKTEESREKRGNVDDTQNIVAQVLREILPPIASLQTSMANLHEENVELKNSLSNLMRLNEEMRLNLLTMLRKNGVSVTDKS